MEGTLQKGTFPAAKLNGMLPKARAPRRLAGIAFLVACGISSFSLVASSEDAEPPRGGVPNTVIFTGSANYPPFQWRDRDGIARGFLIDLQDAIAARDGREARHRLTDWEDALKAVDAGEADVVALFASEERRARFDFTEPVYYVAHGIFSSVRNPVDADPDDLTGLRIAVVNGGFAQDRLLNRADETELLPRANIRSALQAVLAGDADIAVVATHTARRFIAEDDLEVRQTSPPFWPQPYVLAVKRDRNELLEWLQDQVALIQVDGTYHEIYNEWLPELEWQQPTTAEILRQIAWLIVPLLLLASAGYLWSWSLRRKVEIHTENMTKELERRIQLQQELEYQAEHDPLTDLPNRTALINYLKRRIESEPDWTPTLIALRVINREQLMTIFNYSVIQELMKAFARRLNTLDSQMASHLGSGLFVVLSNTPVRGDEILDQLNEPIAVDSIEINPQLALGAVNEARTDGNPDIAGELIRCAITALTASTRKGQSWLVYSSSLEPDPVDLQLLQDFHHHGTRDMFLQYQPKIDLGTGRIDGAEALIRWQHPSLGLVSPARFIRLLEQSGLIRQITHWVIEQSALMGARFGLSEMDCSISVNITPEDLVDTDLLEFITGTMGAVESRYLRLEITETGFIEDPERARSSLSALRNAGIYCAVDDFGTGYSSLSYLSEFPVDEVKIDSKFVGDMLKNDRHMIIVRSTIALAHELGLTVTAEGVEDMATIRALMDLGCDAAQGFLISRPLAENDLLLQLNKDWISAVEGENVS